MAAQRGNGNAVRHGAHSEAAVYPLATNQKRSFLRRNGLRLSDLDGIGVALLDNWSRAQAKVILLDEHFNSEGLLDERGEPRGATRFYVSLLNSARHSLTKLEAHLKDRVRDPQAELAEYLEANYTVEDDGDGDDGD